VGDVANLLGCSLNVPAGITAITFVALGTSLPDTFASKSAAQQDPYADASIGNVTGSNSVNVFLGLGLPWMTAAIYWKVAWNDELKAAWSSQKFKVGNDIMTFEEYGFLDEYPDGGFIVYAGSLGFSVLVFSVLALLCIGVLYMRRVKYGGELGGPKQAQYLSAIPLVGFWLIYVIISSMVELGNIDPADLGLA